MWRLDMASRAALTLPSWTLPRSQERRGQDSAALPECYCGPASWCATNSSGCLRREGSQRRERSESIRPVEATWRPQNTTPRHRWQPRVCAPVDWIARSRFFACALPPLIELPSAARIELHNSRLLPRCASASPVTAACCHCRTMVVSTSTHSSGGDDIGEVRGNKLYGPR
jgi:hypothetical protein